ncbi:protein Skeletor, isoforms B/C-like isoform X1 [Ptychodera flava]|uniref:protein Skeletor, isoforms B/C-like isoform X1 n=1 Tax=Ptychodera flava TaxID=63121 RepID=UPI00396A06D3
MANRSLFVLLCCFATVSELILAASPYHGKLIASFTTLDHGVSGTVYAVDNRRLRIIGFNYDGAAPDAFFWVGDTDSPSPTGVIVPDERGRVSTPLSGYSNRDITIRLPGETTISDYKWLSIWCRQFRADFGHVNFPSGFVAPSEHDLGEFSRLAHGLRGHPYIVDAKTFRIENLHYDGNGPDAYFWVGTGSQPHSNGIKVPDENGSTRPLRGYNGKTVTIQMAGDLTVFDIDWLSMWCVRAVQNFGHVLIPDNLNIPPYIVDMQPEEVYENCEVMNDRYHVSWTLGDDYIDFELSGQVDIDEYMAFGISGSDSTTAMIGADVTVTWNDRTAGIKAVDYDLNDYGQCSQGSGACPDTEVSGARDDVTNIRSMIENGIVRIGFRRMLNTGDSKDKTIRTDREVYVAWALGFINSNGVAAKHHTIPTSAVKVHFGRQASNNCPPFTISTLPPVRAWDQIRIRGDERNTEFTARIGQAGGRRGYAAITDQVSWGIAWYINGKLIPVLELLVGHNYTFIVEGGDDDSNTAQYHPFYITDDPIGGYIQKSTAERRGINLVAGVEFDGAGQAYPTAAGRYCEYESKGVDRAEESETFDDYFKTLTLNCKDGNSSVLRWTPTETGTYYYQCYTHQYLGWKIEVVNTFSSASNLSSADFTVTCLLFVCSLLYIYQDKL